MKGDDHLFISPSHPIVSNPALYPRSFLLSVLPGTPPPDILSHPLPPPSHHFLLPLYLSLLMFPTSPLLTQRLPHACHNIIICQDISSTSAVV